MVRFLHISDLHLGMRITRFSADATDRIREARFEALEHVRDRLTGADDGHQFVIVAGDLFDDVRIKTTIARRAFDVLESFPVPVFVLTGNHDPLEPGSVWDSDPWSETQTKHVQLLRERAPVREFPGVTLFPCPVFKKTSAENPTQWIEEHPRNPEDGIRIGIAHGSVMDRPNLPEDDHPIPPDAPTVLELDYLALGHWHRTNIFLDPQGHPRMAYPGVHEPMRFSGDADSAGWRPYSSAIDSDEFFDDGHGRAMSVTIQSPGSPPVLEELNVGHLRWVSRNETVHTREQLDEVLRSVAEAPKPELTLLRLVLAGTLPLAAMQRLDQLEEVLGRYVVGELESSNLHIEPTEDEIREIVGGGVLKTVYEQLTRKLEERGVSGDEEKQAVAERCKMLLYRLAREAQEQS